MAYSDDKTEKIRVNLEFIGEAKSTFEMWQTMLIKPDDTHPNPEEVVRYALGMLNVFIRTVSEKKKGERTYLAFVTEKESDKQYWDVNEITLPDFSIVTITL